VQTALSARFAHASSAEGVTQRWFATSQRVFEGQTRPSEHVVALGARQPAKAIEALPSAQRVKIGQHR
jgi:hypothetical protein